MKVQELLTQLEAEARDENHFTWLVNHHPAKARLLTILLSSNPVKQSEAAKRAKLSQPSR